MARKKTTEPQEPTEVIEAATTAETEAPEVKVTEPNAEVEAAPTEKVAEPQEPTEEMSETVKDILKTFSDHKELWISKFGGAYTSKPSTSVEAILYKNPYFKS